jgi:hypothetical protein
MRYVAGVQGTAPMKAIAAHKSGPKTIQPDGQPSYSGLRGMKITADKKTLFTGKHCSTCASIKLVWREDVRMLQLAS